MVALLRHHGDALVHHTVVEAVGQRTVAVTAHLMVEQLGIVGAHHLAVGDVLMYALELASI